MAHLRDGLVKRTPEFLVIGAHEAGTTSLFEYLRSHPRLYLPPGKQRPFFSNDDVYARGWNAYLAKTLFAVPEDRLSGTASTEYLAGSPFAANGSRADAAESERIVPRRIHERLPMSGSWPPCATRRSASASHVRMNRYEKLGRFDEAFDVMR